MDVLGNSIASTPKLQDLCICISTKTQGLRYDQNPLARQIYMSGGFVESTFIGVNSYTFQEVVGQLYQVTNELQDLNTIPFAKFRINN